MASSRRLIAATVVVAAVSAAFLGSTPRVTTASGDGVVRAETGPGRVYDADPAHLWNRLYAALYERTARDGRVFGRDEVDPLLWDETDHLLVGPSHDRAIALLDEFLAKHGERLVADPLERALLQRDLWAVFDWTARRATFRPDAGRALQIRLAVAIRRLALSKTAIERLPDTYAAAVASGAFARDFDPDRPDTPFLPPDLFRPDGPWVFVTSNANPTTTPQHAFHFSRSAFLVFVRLPDGRAATLDYLKRVANFPDPRLPDRDRPGSLKPNGALPQFPVGTQLALVRRMMLVDEAGNPVPTSVVESVQIRVHRAIADHLFGGFDTDSPEQVLALANVELGLSRERLFAARAGGLRPVGPDELAFASLGGHGVDAFERREGEPERFMGRTLRGCANCHLEPGVHAVLSRGDSALVSGYALDGEAERAVVAKRNRYDWGLLQGLWLGGASGLRR